MIANMQTLRVLFTLLIVSSHVREIYDVIGVGDVAYAFTHVGSDGFISVSAFLMSYTQARRPKSPLESLKSRLARLIPFYWFITLAVAALTFVAPQVFHTTVVTPETLFKSLFFIPYYKQAGVIQPIVFVGWTMNLFVFYILVFSGALALAGRRAGLLTTAILVGLAMAGMVFHPGDPVLAFFTNPRRLLALAAGQLVCEWWLRVSAAPAASPAPDWLKPACYLLAAFSFGMCALRDVLLSVNAVAADISSAVFGALTVASFLQLERAGAAQRSKLRDALADASFAVYLTHYFVTQIAVLAVGQFDIVDPWPIAAVLVAAHVGAMLVGVATHRLVEKPLGALFRGSTRKPAYEQGAKNVSTAVRAYDARHLFGEGVSPDLRLSQGERIVASPDRLDDWPSHGYRS